MGDSSNTYGNTGAATREPLTGFLVWGLLTFWVYTAVRLAQRWRDHVEERWRDLGPVLEKNAAAGAGDVSVLRHHGFAADPAMPYGAAAAFALSGVLVVAWFTRWILVGSTSDYWTIMGAVGLSSLLFYAGTCALVLWLARRLEAHEQAEVLIIERGPDAVSALRRPPPAVMVARWEQLHNHVALFLIVALPMVASPVLGAHFFLTRGVADDALWPAALCFVLAALFHYWGTKLLVGLYNGHLAFVPAHRAGPADVHSSQPAAVMVSAPPADTIEPYDGDEPYIFVSYKRDDLERITPVLQRINSWGYRVWYDKGIPGGAEWDALIEQKLKGCILMLFFVSRGSVESKYCRREVKYTDQLNKPILSIRMEPVELAHGLEMLLTQYQMVDVGAQDFSGEIKRALQYLRLL